MRNPHSIGYVARLAGVSVSTLRAWEDHGLLIPQKSESGHRYYAADDIERAKRIERYRSISGMSIPQIKRQLAHDDELDARQAHQRPASETEGSSVGARVRTLRKQMGWSMRELAERSGIAQSQLSMFERGHGSLGSARLNTLAMLFGKGLTELLGGTASGDSPVFRQGTGRVVEGMGDGVRVEQITVGERLLDAEFWTIAPGGESDGFYSHEGEELIYVVDGEFELTLADAGAEVLRTGDCAYFNSRVEHRWRNLSGRAVTVLWVNTDSDRLSGMRFARADRKLGLGAISGSNLGEGSLTVDLPPGVQTYRTVEAHTAGHITRVLVESLPGLDQETLAGKVEFFKGRYDHLRALLLDEPRGHLGAFGLIPVKSSVADFGAFFVTAYGYPAMGNHAIVGYARVLASLGRLNNRSSFTIEVPSGVVEVELGRLGDPANVTITLPSVGLNAESFRADLHGQTVDVELGALGTPAALIHAPDLGIPLVPESIALLTSLGAELRRQFSARGDIQTLDSIVFYDDGDGQVSRQFATINNLKFDRSPGILGAAVRAVQQVRDGRAPAGAILSFASVFGDTVRAEVAPEGTTRRDMKAVVKITARSHLNAVSTFIYEPTDRLYSR
jgi:proline racemase